MVAVTTEQKTKKQSKTEPEKNWYIVDAKGKVLGRLATRIAIVLMGKRKPTWQPHLDTGDCVIVVNASKVMVTGRKETQKIYYRYSGYPGGLKEENLEKLRARKPEHIIHHAVRGMLPKNRLGRVMIKKLFIYPGEKHPHEAQKAQELEV
jgi:large subunit ribosomal protein L13